MQPADAIDRSSEISLRQVAALFEGRHVMFVGLVACSVAGGLCEASILATVAQAAGALVDGTKHINADVGSIHISATVGGLLAVAFGLALARLLLQWPLTTMPARISADVAGRLQRSLFAAYTHASWTEQSRDREGDLQELMTNQVLQAAYGGMAAAALITAALTLAVLLFSAFLLNALAAIVVSFSAVALLVALRPLNQMAGRRSGGLSAAQMDLASGVGQATRLAEETHVFGVGEAQRSRIELSVTDAQRFFYQTQVLGRLGPSIYQSAIYLLVVGGLALISALHAGHVAALGAVVLLLVRAGSYGQNVQGAFQTLRQALPFVDRVQRVIDRYEASTPVSGNTPLPAITSVAFEDVSFAYTPGRPVLNDIEFEVRSGETIGIIGPSGAGKSTLVQILLQLRSPGDGRYLLNGSPADGFAREDWYHQLAYVPQAPKLLHASVADNIRYLRDISDADVEHAARLARIHDEVMSWEDGYETIIGPRADAVSGGQQQRICIARALAARPDVLVLDEPTSALDPRSEALLQESLLALKEGLTLFIVAHRMSTLDICDRVMVIQDGRLDAFDSTPRLREHNSYYRFAAEVASGIGQE